MKGWGREKEGDEKKQENRGKLEKQGDSKET